MAANISASFVIHHQEKEARATLDALDHASCEVAVTVVDLAPDEMTAENLSWAYHGISVLPRKTGEHHTASQNAVLPQLNCTYHLFLDPGITFAPVMLEHMVSYMNGHPNIAVLAPVIVNHNELVQPYALREITVRSLLGFAFGRIGGVFRRWRNACTMEDMDIATPLSVKVASASCMLVRTEVLQAVQGFDTRYHHFLAGPDLCTKIIRGNKGSVVFHPDMKVVQSLPVAHEENVFSKLISACRYLIKWGWVW